MSREGRKRRRSRKWTPLGGLPTPIRDLSNGHLTNLHHMMTTGEVRAGGNVVKTPQVTPAWRQLMWEKWETPLMREIARRVVRRVQGR